MTALSLDLPKDTKFLCTCQVYWELDAASEVWHCLRATGVCDSADIVFIRSHGRLYRGMFAVVFRGDAREAARRVRRYLEAHPWILKYTSRIVPVELVTADLQEVVAFVEREANARIGESERWKVRVERHEMEISRDLLIDAIAKVVRRGKVDLERPDWIINVECVRRTFAVSIIRPEELIQRKELRKLLRGRLLSVEDRRLS